MPLADLKHVFVLMLENRSFDHLLGAVSLTGVDPSGAPASALVAAPDSFTNLDANGNVYANTSPAPVRMPADPPHEYDDVVTQLLGANQDPPNNYANIPINNSGFVKSYASTGVKSPGDVLTSFAPAQIPNLAALAQAYCVCDHWFSSLPGPTLPNRFFLMAASSNGNPKSPAELRVADAEFIDSFSFANGDIFQRIKQQTSRTFRIYRGDTLPFASLLAGVDYDADTVPYDPAGFAADCNQADLPDFIFIEPSYGIFNGYVDGTSQHPRADIGAGDRLIGQVYQGISQSKCWPQSALIITYDEHGGFFEHTVPPKTVNPGDAHLVYDFNFTQLGVRVPAVVVSPLLIRRRMIDSTVYDHTSVLATLRALFPEIGAFTNRDRAATPLVHLFDGPAADLTPSPLPAAAAAPAASPAVALTDDAEPLDHAESSGLRIAGGLRNRVGKVPKAKVLAELAPIRTKGQARAYMRQVDEFLRARRPASSPRRKTPAASRARRAKPAGAKAKGPADRGKGRSRTKSRR